jgi:hypothetical protein
MTKILKLTPDLICPLCPVEKVVSKAIYDYQQPSRDLSEVCRLVFQNSLH